MVWRVSLRWAVALSMTGCQIEAAVSAVTEVRPFEESSSTAAGETTPGGSSEAATGASEGSDGSGGEGESEGSGASSGVSASAGDGEGLPEDPPPTISSFKVSPGMMSVAGPISIEVAHSEDVVEVEIWRGGALAFAVAPTWDTATMTTLPIVHAPGDEGEVLLHAVVRDASGQTATSAAASVMVELPASGSLAWEKALPDSQDSQALAVAAVDEGTVLGGWSADANLNVSATLDGLDAGGSLSWSASGSLPAGALTMALAERLSDGRRIVAGSTWDGTWVKSRPWARLFDAEGGPTSALWLGEPTSVVHAAGALPDGRVVLAGAVLTSTQPALWDARVWILGAELDGLPVTVTWENSNSGLLKGEANDEARSLAVTAMGHVVIAGSTETFVVDDFDPKVPRAFVLRMSSTGKILDEWVAPPELGMQSGALGVAVDPLGGILVAGWSRTPPTPGTSPMLLRLEDALEVSESWVDLGGPTGPSQARRLVRNPAGYLVAALNRYAVGVGVDIEIAAANDVASFAAPIWVHAFPDPFGTDQEVAALEVSRFGVIHFVGWTYDNLDKHRKRIVGVLHP